jgi:hypothetical protein
VHAEKTAQTKKIDGLLTQAAEDSNKLAENDETIRKLGIENAALKRQAQALKDEMEAQRVLFQGKLMFSELKSSEFEKKCVSLEQEIAIMQQTMKADVPTLEMETRTLELCQSNAETQTKAVVQVEMETQTKTVVQVEMDTQTVTGYVAYAADKTSDWMLRAYAVKYAVCKELREILNQVDRLEESLDNQELEIHQEQAVKMAAIMPKVEVTQAVETIEVAPEAEVTLAVETIEPAPEAAVAQKAKKANKKKKAPKETQEEKQAKEEAERKAHEEAVRARKEQERREEAKKTADRKAKMQALRAKKEQEVRAELMQAKTFKPATSDSFELDVVRKFNHDVKSTFVMRDTTWAEMTECEETPAFLTLYVLECFGMKSWKLEQVNDKYRLVLDRSEDGTIINYSSSLVRSNDIVLWVERDEFVKSSQTVFKYTPVPKEERFATMILKSFGNIRLDKRFEILELCDATELDHYGLAMQKITLKDKTVLTCSMVKLIVWFNLGKIDAMATAKNPFAFLSELDDLLGPYK